MRDRLIKLIDGFVFGTQIVINNLEWNSNTVKDLSDYLLANGVIVPPCKVGDTVYILKNGEIHRNHVCQIHISQTYAQTFFSCYGEKFGVEQIGKNVFLTRENAEKALKGEKG